MALKKWRVMAVVIVDTQKEASLVAMRLSNELEDMLQDGDIADEVVPVVEEIEEA